MGPKGKLIDKHFVMNNEFILLTEHSQKRTGNHSLALLLYIKKRKNNYILRTATTLHLNKLFVCIGKNMCWRNIDEFNYFN